MIVTIDNLTRKEDKMAISSFTGQYEFLSNFYPCVIVYDGLTYQSTEAAYQAHKTLDLDQRSTFTSVAANISKKMGRRVSLRPDWESIKDKVMEDVLREKFKIGHLKEKLLATGAEELIEGNTWNDRYWGVCNGSGKNMLGKLLMKIRDELKLSQMLEKFAEIEQ
jgi:ribA/ribD-fused uncharacterized protein